jgi:hypothetical protein
VLSCDVREGAGWEPPLTGRWDFICTRSAVFLRGDRVIRVDYPSIASLELEEVQRIVSKKAGRAVGKAGVMFGVGTLLGSDASWSLARAIFDAPRVRITLTTASGHAVLIGICAETFAQLQGRMSAVYGRLNGHT